MLDADTDSATPPAETAPDLSALLVHLLKGVLYRDDDERLWGALLRLQARVREHSGVLGLELVLDDAEGYAFLRSRHTGEETESDTPRMPRLVARRPLSYAVSLMLALLRKKLAEFDAGGGDTRLVLSRDDLVELIRVFLPEGPNEARLIDQIETTINKVVELGFLRALKPGASGGAKSGLYEVRRILKAFVDAQWLADFDARLETYRTSLGTATVRGKGTKDE